GGDLPGGVGQVGELARFEPVVKGMLDQMNALATAYESVKDKNSAKAAAARINQICDRLSDLARQAKALGSPSPTVDDQLQKKYEPELKKAEARLQKAATQAGLLSGGDPDFLKANMRLQDIGTSIQGIGR